MRISRRYTEAGQDIYESIEFRVTSSEIRNPDGSLVFKADEIEQSAVGPHWDLSFLYDSRAIGNLVSDTESISGVPLPGRALAFGLTRVSGNRRLARKSEQGFPFPA